MNKAELIISEKNGIYLIRVTGRANFECGMPLRTFTQNYTTSSGKIVMDMQGCESMDSTFMGILTMLVLKARKLNSEFELVNITDNCRGLLRGLGVEKMFKFVAAPIEEELEGTHYQGNAKEDKVNAAEAVVEAHKTLMNVSLDNIAKFEKVVEFAEADLEALKKEQKD